MKTHLILILMLLAAACSRPVVTAGFAPHMLARSDASSSTPSRPVVPAEPTPTAPTTIAPEPTAPVEAMANELEKFRLILLRVADEMNAKVSAVKDADKPAEGVR